MKAKENYISICYRRCVPRVHRAAHQEPSQPAPQLDMFQPTANRDMIPLPTPNFMRNITVSWQRKAGLRMRMARTSIRRTRGLSTDTITVPERHQTRPDCRPPPFHRQRGPRLPPLVPARPALTRWVSIKLQQGFSQFSSRNFITQFSNQNFFTNSIFFRNSSPDFLMLIF